MDKILGIILRIFGRDVPNLITRGAGAGAGGMVMRLLLDGMMHGCFPTNGMLVSMLALVVGEVADNVWTVQSGSETIFLQERDVGFRARSLILIVVDDLESMKVRVVGSHFDWRGGFPSAEKALECLGTPKDHQLNDRGRIE